MKRALLAAATIGAGVACYRRVIRPWWWSWGVDTRDVARDLPGDDLVPFASTADTRSIEIAAPTSDVWPWLIQMGYGRGGWYSYDAIDMAGSSTRRLVPGFPAPAVGDIVPTHPGGGFEVRIVEPGHAFVLYSDTRLVARQRKEAQATGAASSAANVQATGAFLGATQPTEFAASWAFILEPVEADRTRLIERFRVTFGESREKPWTALTLPILGFGVFLMTRKQMLGIRERAESLARPRPVRADSDPERPPTKGALKIATETVSTAA